jgi:hypothetical protein
MQISESFAPLPLDASLEARKITLYHPFEKLPTCLFFFLSGYISRQEYFKLMNTSILLFLATKRETVSYELSFRTSIRYCKEEKFRALVQKQVNNPRRQISLDLYSCFHRNISRIYSFGCQNGLRQLMIRDVDDSFYFSALSYIEDLLIQNFSNIKNLKGLKSVLKLKVLDFEKLFTLSHLSTGCPDLQEIVISNCSSLKSLKGIEHIPKVSVEYCRYLKDISALGRQKELKLKGLSKITDVSHLRNIPSLEIIDCPEITDIHQLDSVYSLSITNCPKIQDFSCLTKNSILSFDLVDSLPVASGLSPGLSPGAAAAADIAVNTYFHSAKEIRLCYHSKLSSLNHISFPSCESLSLSHCDHLNNYSFNGWKNIPKKVHLYRCYGITDVSMFRNVQSLTLEFLRFLTKLEEVGNIRFLKIVSCENLSDISCLGGLNGNQEVVLSNCHKIHDFSSLKMVPKVNIIDCEGFHNGLDVQFVKNLILERCSKIIDLSMFVDSAMESLDLLFCSSIQSLKGIEKVKKVLIYNCLSIVDYCGLDKCRHVRIKTLNKK